MTTYRERLKAGIHDAAKQPDPEPELDPDNLPGRHAQLDELATARGIVLDEGLTVADKQEAIRASLSE